MSFSIDTELLKYYPVIVTSGLLALSRNLTRCPSVGPLPVCTRGLLGHTHIGCFCIIPSQLLGTGTVVSFPTVNNFTVLGYTAPAWSVCGNQHSSPYLACLLLGEHGSGVGGSSLR